MKSWSKFIVRKVNIICAAENFYCAEIVMSEAFGIFWNTPPRIRRSMGGANRRLRQRSWVTISLRGGAWMKPAHACILGVLWVLWVTLSFQVLDAKRKSSGQESRRQESLADGFFYVSLVTGIRRFLFLQEAHLYWILRVTDLSSEPYKIYLYIPWI